MIVRTLALAALLAGAGLAADAQPAARAAAKPAARPPAHAMPAPDTLGIVAVVNGEAITQGDVNNRRRLFALTTGQGISPEVLDRLTPQVTRQLIDERLRLQEVQKHHIAVQDQDIAAALGDIEKRNGMQPGGLRAKLSTAGIDLRTLIDQVRVQIGWLRVLREVLGTQADVSPADIDEREKLFKGEIGQPEFHVGEIFVPIVDAAQAEDAGRFADTIITQLRNGAPFAVTAAQFSQSQTALQGGDLGWVRSNQLEPDELKVLQEMPIGAVSNPIRVPGGIAIVSLAGRREIGRDPATMVRMRQVFFPFPTRLDPANPTEQQRAIVERTRALSNTLKDCPAVEAAAAAAGEKSPPDPGEVRAESVSVPALRQLLLTQAVGKASQPLIAEDGVGIMMVCSREERNLGIPDRKVIASEIQNERVELASRQLMRDLQRRAMIDRRS